MFSRRRAIGWIALSVGLIGSFALGAIRDYNYGGDIVWQDDIPAANAPDDRPELISFHSKDCDWCRKMDAETYTDPEVVTLSHRFRCVRIDTRSNPEMVTRYHVLEMPCVVVANSHGVEIKRSTGYLDAAAMRSLLKSASK